MNSSTRSLGKAPSSPAHSRQPLLPRIFDPNSGPTAVKQVRRKTSFVIRSESTEDLPSSHASIYEAAYFSGNSDDNDNQVEPLVLPMVEKPVEKTEVVEANDENTKHGAKRITSITIPDTQFLYGHGTMLTTITEQKSYLTMRSLACTKSADDLHKTPILWHKDSFVLAKEPRRRQSFSLDDLDLIKRSYHEACMNIVAKATESLPIAEIYAEPKIPIHAPLSRPGTPPGMPSWTSSQGDHIPPRTSSAGQAVFSDQQQTSRLRWLNPMALLETHFRSDSNLNPSTPPPGRPAPRFRPPRSSYTAIDSHPFTRAPIAEPTGPQSPPGFPTTINSRLTGKRKFGQRVRFSPSATARDSEMNNLRVAIESTSSSALNPIAPMVASPRTYQIPTKPTCPHRKGRRAQLNALSDSLNRHTTTPPSNEYSPGTQNLTIPQALQTPSLRSCHTSIDLSSRSASYPYSSTEHLMPPSPKESKIKSEWCWKCKVNSGFEKINDLWISGTGAFCFVCCGFDVQDEDGDVRVIGGGGSGRRNSPVRNLERRELGYGFGYGLDGNGRVSVPMRVVRGEDRMRRVSERTIGVTL